MTKKNGVFETVKKHEQATTLQVATALKITLTAAHTRLKAVEEQGLIARSAEADLREGYTWVVSP